MPEGRKELALSGEKRYNRRVYGKHARLKA